MKNKYFDIHKPVFIPATIILLMLVFCAFFFSAEMKAFFENFQSLTSIHFGWFFILSTNIYVIASLIFAFSRLGKIRIGGSKAKPDFSTFGWFSMLFSAGLGIGLLFYGVAEPMFHFSNPPMEVGNVSERASNAMLFTFLHYGLHGWSPYVIIGMALAYFTYNKNLPLTISSLFYPILGDKVNGIAGNIIDTVAVLATIFGLATTLGLGVQQIGSGIEYLTKIQNGSLLQISLIAIITLIATASVILGLDKGVKFLSVINMRLALAFLIVILVLGPTSHLLDSFVQNTGNYFNSIIRIGSWTESYGINDWQHDWTVFYWAWWISWSPFVGMFIARVSKGRTIREFVLGVLLVPSLLVFLWMSVFGGTAINMQINEVADIASAINTDMSTALYAMLNELPFSKILSFIGVILVTIFFVTSSDSGSLVIDSITSGGKLDAPVGQRIFWALTEGLVAASLLFSGGLKALQSAVISIGLPFSIIILAVIYALFKELKNESDKRRLKAEQKEIKEYQDYIKNLIKKEVDEL
jgi:choline/glycine/proline betaine transport protein